jgi:hypothetical protein
MVTQNTEVFFEKGAEKIIPPDDKCPQFCWKYIKINFF